MQRTKNKSAVDRPLEILIADRSIPRPRSEGAGAGGLGGIKDANAAARAIVKYENHNLHLFVERWRNFVGVSSAFVGNEGVK